MKISPKLWAAAIVMLLVVVPVWATAEAQTLETKAEDNIFQFITDVMGIDTSAYEVTHHSYSASYPSKYGGIVKEELITLIINSTDESSIVANVIMNNGYVYSSVFTLYGQISRDMAYNVSSVEKAKNILSRYQNFTSKLGVSSNEVPSALMMLSPVTELAPLTVTNGNMKMQITSAKPRSEIRLDYNIDFKFVYTENGVDSSWRVLGVGFDCIYGNTEFQFADTWGLFSSYSTELPCLSESEAEAIAWEAAENYQIELLNVEDNSTISITPKWPETLTVESDMDMVAGQLYNDSRLIGLSMGSSPRDPLTLYPLWKFLFYVEPMGDIVGVQVGVWGDTKEVAYCGTYGFYGMPETSLSPQPTETSPEQIPSPQPTEEAPTPNALQPSTIIVTSDTALIVASILAISAVAVIAVIIIRKRER